MSLVLILAIALQGAPVRDPGQSAAAAVVIRGRVTAAATRQPLHRVRITIDAADPRAPSTVTDTRGVFELKVPAGSYHLSAVRAGYLTIQYGQRRPRESGQTLDVKTGDVIANVDFAMYKGGVISGRVVDESGDAAPGVRVEAVEQRYIRGRRVPVAARIVTTNDAGEYRLSGLEPGAYTVRASSADVWDSDDGTSTYVYAPTYFPGVTAGDRLEMLNVALGQELSGMDLRLVPGRAAQIRGTVMGATGEPVPGMAVHLDVITRTTGGALMSAGLGGTTQTDARGAFVFPRVAPGEYTVYGGSSTERAVAAISVGEGDTRNVVLAPGRQPVLTGVVRLDEEGPPPFAPSRVRIEPIPAGRESVLPAWGDPRPETARADWTVRFASLDGPYLFRVSGLPVGWRLQSVTLGDRDFTDTPLTIDRAAPDVTGLQILLTRTSGTLAGDVADAAGAPARDATVIVFAEQPERWGFASRSIQAAHADVAGRFSVTALPPGFYRAIALEAVVDGQWEDPEFLQSLIKDAVRVELKAHAPESIKLTIGGAR